MIFCQDIVLNWLQNSFFCCERFMPTEFDFGHTMKISGEDKSAWLKKKFETMVLPQFRVVSQNSVLDGKKVLEFGCFAGQLTDYINKNSSAKCVGLDVKLLEKRENLYEYDGERIPFNSEEFDIVTCFEVIEHVFKPAETLAEINRVLKKGGELYITAPNKFWVSLGWGHNSLEMQLRHIFHKNPDCVNLFSWWEITKMLEDAGFNWVSLQKKPFWLSRGWLFKCVKIKNK